MEETGLSDTSSVSHSCFSPCVCTLLLCASCCSSLCPHSWGRPHHASLLRSRQYEDESGPHSSLHAERCLYLNSLDQHTRDTKYILEDSSTWRKNVTDFVTCSFNLLHSLREWNSTSMNWTGVTGRSTGGQQPGYSQDYYTRIQSLYPGCGLVWATESLMISLCW